MVLRLRPLRLDDEEQFREVHRAATDYPFGLGYDPALPWSTFLDALNAQRVGIGTNPALVPSTFLVADLDGVIVGRVSIRHELNEFLDREGGHIGYYVVERFRRRGYATEMLRQGLVVARSLGVGRVLVTCDDDNEGSATVIERCGGELAGVVVTATGPKRRYWID